ncbi:tetratricopeptide repeat protein [Pyxidicoccus sp. 3LG]
MHLTDVKGKVDFGIITILDDEFLAVLDRFPAEGRVTGRRQYNLRRVPLSGGASYRVAVVCCIEQGTGEAQSAANDLLEDLSPRWLLVVGIAGGVPSSEVGLGDVVLSTRIHDFSVEAVLHDKQTEYSLAGGPMEKVAAAFAKNLRALEPELGEWGSPEAIGVPRPEVDAAKASLYGPEDWQRRVRASLERHAARKHPVAMAGPIASSDRLIKKAEVLDVWLKVARHVLAVEMEAAGIYRATHGPHVPCLAIRGISDIVGLERQPEWTKYACHTAAAFAFALLQTRPIEPVSPSTTDPHAQKLRSLVARYPFPRAQDVDPYHLMGVTESELARHYAQGDTRPPYVMRDADAELDRALTTSDLVLLVGHSKSGKSRAAFEAALRLYPKSPLIIPADRESLAELSHIEPPLEWAPDPAIVWLDDLQRFLGPNGLSVSVLNRLTQERGRVKLLATMTSKRYEDYLRSTSDVEKELVLLLRRFRQVRIESELSLSEAQRAQALYPNEPREKLVDGLGEHLVAAHELWNKYDTAKATFPQGHALVRAAIDWRRAGLQRPIPESTLQRLAARYIQFLRLSHVDLTPESFEEGLRWAREPIALHVALLSKTGEEETEKHFEPFDYLIDHTDSLAVGLPAEAWDSFLKVASPSEALVVGVSAFQRKNRAVFQKALQQAIQSGDETVKPRAMYGLGILHQEEGRNPEAEDAYRQALASAGASEIASWTRVALANLIQVRGEREEAERLYRQVIATPELEAEATAMAAHNLGLLLQHQGKLAEAERLFRNLLGAEHTEVAALAANNLGTLHQRRGEREEAERLFMQAIDSEHANASLLGRLSLGKLYAETGELDKAEHLYRELAASDNPREAALGTANLGRVRHQRGDPKEAERLYRKALAANVPEAMGYTLNNLGSVFLERGEDAEAERIFRQAIDAKQEDAADMARVNLGLILFSRGEQEQAEKLYRQSLRSIEPLAVALAANNLGLLVEQRGNLEEARSLFQQAIESRQSEVVPLALCNLGSLLQDEEKLDEAIPLLRQSLQFKRHAGTLKAQMCLGIALVERQEPAEAEQLLRAVVDAKHPDLSPRAALVLGDFYDDHQRKTEAEQLLRLAMESEHPIAMHARLKLGTILGDRGDLAAAEPLFQAGLDSGDADFISASSAALGYIREKQGDFSEAERLYRAALEKPNEEFESDVRVQLGKLLLRRGETAEAIQVLMPALESSDTDTVRRARAALTQARRAGPKPGT